MKFGTRRLQAAYMWSYTGCINAAVADMFRCLWDQTGQPWAGRHCLIKIKGSHFLICSRGLLAQHLFCSATRTEYMVSIPMLYIVMGLTCSPSGVMVSSHACKPELWVRIPVRAKVFHNILKQLSYSTLCKQFWSIYKV